MKTEAKVFKKIKELLSTLDEYSLELYKERHLKKDSVVSDTEQLIETLEDQLINAWEELSKSQTKQTRGTK